MEIEKNHKSRIKKLKGKEATAKVVKDIADISYRQINDWDAKNMLPKKKGGRSKTTGTRPKVTRRTNWTSRWNRLKGY